MGLTLRNSQGRSCLLEQGNFNPSISLEWLCGVGGSNKNNNTSWRLVSCSTHAGDFLTVWGSARRSSGWSSTTLLMSGTVHGKVHVQVGGKKVRAALIVPYHHRRQPYLYTLYTLHTVTLLHDSCLLLTQSFSHSIVRRSISTFRRPMLPRTAEA